MSSPARRPPLHIPLADVQLLAACLQYDKRVIHSACAGLSLAQVSKAEAIIRKLIREHLDGKWEKKERQPR